VLLIITPLFFISTAMLTPACTEFSTTVVWHLYGYRGQVANIRLSR